MRQHYTQSGPAIRVEDLWTDGVAGVSVLWNRDGEIRLIPWAMIRNCHERLASMQAAHAAGLVPETPAHAYLIRWEDCLPLPEFPLRVKVDVGHDPFFDLPEQQRHPRT